MIPPQEVILEACLETPEEAHSAFLSGAHRVELCRNLESGGLSPSRETVRRCLEICELPLKVLLKPQRPGLAMPGLRSRLWAAPVLLQTLKKWD